MKQWSKSKTSIKHTERERKRNYRTLMATIKRIRWKTKHWHFTQEWAEAWIKLHDSMLEILGMHAITLITQFHSAFARQRRCRFWPYWHSESSTYACMTRQFTCKSSFDLGNELLVRDLQYVHYHHDVRTRNECVFCAWHFVFDKINISLQFFANE